MPKKPAFSGISGGLESEGGWIRGRAFAVKLKA
jgi:hypothetical protein